MNLEHDLSHASDFDWDAFRYVAGEMSAEDADAFEQILAEDLAACDAVARATQLSLATRTILDDQSSPPLTPQPLRHEHTPTRRAAAAVVAFAAMSLLMLLLYLPETATAPPAPSNVAKTDLNELQAAAELISHWSSSTAPAADEFATEIVELFETPPEPAADADIVPSWLLAAVSLESPTAEQLIMDDPPAPASKL